MVMGRATMISTSSQAMAEELVHAGRIHRRIKAATLRNKDIMIMAGPEVVETQDHKGVAGRGGGANYGRPPTADGRGGGGGRGYPNGNGAPMNSSGGRPPPLGRSGNSDPGSKYFRFASSFKADLWRLKHDDRSYPPSPPLRKLLGTIRFQAFLE